jgi:hypothetical protein
MTKSCHGFKAAPQQNRIVGRFFLAAVATAVMDEKRSRRTHVEPPSVLIAGDPIDRLSLATVTPLLFGWRRGHA